MKHGDQLVLSAPATGCYLSRVRVAHLFIIMIDEVAISYSASA